MQTSRGCINDIILVDLAPVDVVSKHGTVAKMRHLTLPGRLGSRIRTPTPTRTTLAVDVAVAMVFPLASRGRPQDARSAQAGVDTELGTRTVGRSRMVYV